MSNYTANSIKDDPNHAWNKIIQFISKDSDILDIGCGSGNLGEFLIKQNKCRVDGVEPDKGDAQLASKKLRQVWACDIETAVVQIKKKYDYLIFADVIEHLLHPDEVLKNVRSLLKPGGAVVFSIPNMAHVSTRLGILGGNFDYTETGILDKTHLNFWTLKRIEEVFGNSGMEIVKVDAVVYKYTEKLIQNRLKEIGFSAQEKGIAQLTDINASAFQFVGSARYTSSKLTKQKPLVFPEELLASDIRSLFEKDMAKQQKIIEDYQRHTKNLENHVKYLEEQIDLIKNSRSYKIAVGLTGIKSKIRKDQ